MILALICLRTSSATNVGVDKNSERRQRAAITVFAAGAGYAIAGEHHDAAVSGADPVEGRPGFAAVLDRVEADGVRVAPVEDAPHFARSSMAQGLGALPPVDHG